jgi:hypothetical protein
MATDFPVTQDQIIQRAMRICGALDPTSLPSPTDYQFIGLALNMLIKNWVKDGIPLWKVAQIAVPMVANQATYLIGTLGPDIVTDRILRVTEAQILVVQGQQTITLRSLAREQYVERSGKFIAFGQPVEYWFQPLGSELTEQSSSLTVYPTPNVGTALSPVWTILLNALQPIQNTVALTDILDFPSEYYLPLSDVLAYTIANEYPVSAERYARIEKRAEIGQEQISEWGQEQDVDVQIKYDARGR